MPMSVEDAFYHSVHDYPGGAECLATRLSPKKSATTLCHEAKPPEGSSAKAGLITAVQVMEHSGDLRILHAVCARMGGMFVPLPSALVTSDNILEAVGRLASEFGDLVGTITKVSSDGDISINDMKAVQKEAGELMAALNHAMQVLTDQHQADQQ